MGHDARSPKGPRCIALVGPFQSGKTTLLDAILARTGAIPKVGSVEAGTSTGDASAEARRHKMSVGLTAATTTFMGDDYTFIGFPVVDIAVTLIDGSYHSVDSSDLAFRTAARAGVTDALPQCQPVLLEPVHVVEIVCPTDATAKINAILSGRRGQILGFDTRADWPGWDCVRAMLPEAEIGDLIVDVRSATAGAGSFTRSFDHMAEVTGRTADQIVAAHRVAA